MSQFLTFQINDQNFVIDVQKVCHIKKYEDMKITNSPGSSWYVEGISYYRDRPIAICNLPKFFAQNSDDIECVIFTESENVEGESILGIMVDKVNEIITINDDDIEQYSKVFFKTNYTNIITSVVKHNDDLYNVVNIDKLHNL